MISQKRMNIRPLFFGFLTKDWCQTQHAFLVRNNFPHKQQQARTGIFQIGLLFARFPKKLWNLRNHDSHAPATKQVPGCRRLFLLSKVQALYDLEPHVLSFDKSTFFSTPFAERTTQSNQQLQTYVDYFHDLIHDSVTQAADMGPNFRPINDYFALPPEPQVLTSDLNETAP